MLAVVGIETADPELTLACASSFVTINKHLTKETPEYDLAGDCIISYVVSVQISLNLFVPLAI